MDIQNIFKYRLNIIIASAILFIVLDLIIETPLQNWLYFFIKMIKSFLKEFMAKTMSILKRYLKIP